MMAEPNPAADAWLDLLIEHDIAYFGMVAQCDRTEHAVFLHAPDFSEYRDANRALRLRAAGRPIDDVAAEIAEYYRRRGLPPVADVDPIAEAEGFGSALARLGLTEVAGDRLLMRYASRMPPEPAPVIPVEVVANERGGGEAAEWIETAVADDLGWPDEPLWRRVAEMEARFVPCRLYLARQEGRPAGVCDLFQHAELGPRRERGDPAGVSPPRRRCRARCARGRRFANEWRRRDVSLYGTRRSRRATIPPPRLHAVGLERVSAV